MKVKAKEKEIIHVEIVDEKTIDCMLAIAREKGGRVQYQCNGAAPNLLAAATIMLAETVASATEDLDMPEDAKLGAIDLVCKKAKEALKEKLAEGAEEEDEDDGMPSDLKEALKRLEKLNKMLKELGGL